MDSQQYYQNQTPYKAGVGAVNIQIYNPSVTPSGASSKDGYIPNGANYGNYTMPSYPPMAYPQVNTNHGAYNYSPQQINNNFIPPPPVSKAPSNQKAENKHADIPPPPKSANKNEQGNFKKPMEPMESKQPEVKPPSGKKVEISPPPPLSNDYIKSLEFYLNSQNKQERFNAANQLVSDFRVHKSRQSDPQLTPLLNKVLKDPYQGVRLLGLSVINSGHAKGDDETISLLKGMQKSGKAYNQDALLASDILLKMAGDKIKPTYPGDKTNSPKIAKPPTPGKNLNVVSG